MSKPDQSTVGWQAVAAASMDGVGVVEDGAFVHVNEQFAEMHGHDDPAELVGEPWHAVCARSERGHVEREVLPAVHRDGSWRGEVPGRRADGTAFPREVSIRQADGGALVWVGRDLPVAADDGQGEDHGSSRNGDAGRGEGRYRRLYEAAPVPIAVFTADRGFVYCNRAAVEFLGAADREAVLGRSPSSFVHPEDREQVERRIRQVVEEREPTEPIEERLVGLDGERRIAVVATAPVRFDGEPAAQVVLNDVTEYRRAEERLREERRFVQHVIDAIDDVLYVLDEDGETHLWNDALADRTGYTDGEIADVDPVEFLPPEHREFTPGANGPLDALDDRRVDLELLTKDGERIPHEFRGTTFEDPETGRVFRCGIARDVSERKRRERELERYETIVETVDDGIYAIDEEIRFTFVNEGLCEMLGRSREELLGYPARELFVEADGREMAAEMREKVVRGDASTGILSSRIHAADETIHGECRYRLHPEPDGEFRGSVGVIRDDTERVERERALERQRDELATLARINDLLHDVTRELVGATSREAIERAVCERLVDSELYRFAWTGTREYDGDEIVPGASAGDDDGYLDEVTITADDAATGRGPAGRAMRTGEVQVANVDSAGFEPWREAALDRGFESAVAVPLTHGETVYGVLIVYATRPDAFSEREQHGLAVLGETVGFTIGATKHRRLLFADAVVELEFQVGDPESLLTRVTDAVDCRLELDGYVGAGDRWLLYLDVDGASADEVAAAVDDEPTVERTRVVGDDGGGLEVVTTGASLLHRLAPAGVQVRSAVAEDGGATVVLEAPADADVGHVADLVDAAFDTATLRAQRDRDRAPETLRPASSVLDGLTARQREALEAAFRAGYFEWPRASTAEEVADGLAISAPTFHGHIRKAERAVFSGLFD